MKDEALLVSTITVNAMQQQSRSLILTDLTAENASCRNRCSLRRWNQQLPLIIAAAAVAGFLYFRFLEWESCRPIRSLRVRLTRISNESTRGPCQFFFNKKMNDNKQTNGDLINGPGYVRGRRVIGKCSSVSNQRVGEIEWREIDFIAFNLASYKLPRIFGGCLKAQPFFLIVDPRSDSKEKLK